MCTYIKKISECRYIAQTAIVKVRIGSPKRAQNEQVCVHQVTQKVNFPKHLWGSYAREGL